MRRLPTRARHKLRTAPCEAGWRAGSSERPVSEPPPGKPPREAGGHARGGLETLGSQNDPSSRFPVTNVCGT